MGRNRYYSSENSSVSDQKRKKDRKRKKEYKIEKDYKRKYNRNERPSGYNTRDNKRSYNKNRKNRYEFDSPPRKGDKKKKEEMNKGLGILSELLPGMHNLSVNEILAKINTYQKTSREQRLKTEKKLYIGNIPKNIDKKIVN